MDYRSLGKRPIEGSEYAESPSKKQSACDGHHLWLRPLPDLELRLGPPPAQRETHDFLAQFGRTPDQIAERQGVQPQERAAIILRQQSEIYQASSSRQQFGWQGQEAFHLAQTHQEIGPSSQPEVIDDQMPTEISSDSDNEPSHERTHHQAGSSNLVRHGFPIPLDQISWHQIIQAQRNIQIERTGDESSYRQTQGDSASLASRPDRSLGVLQMFAQAVRNQGHRQRLPEYLFQEKKSRPFNYSEYKKIHQIYKDLGIKEPELGNLRRKVYNMTEMGKEATEKYRNKKK